MPSPIQIPSPVSAPFPVPVATPHGPPTEPVAAPLQIATQRGQVPLTIAFVGVGMYSAIGLLTLVAMIFPPQRIAPTRQSRLVQRMFCVLVLVFCVLRVAWFCFPIAHVDPGAAYVVNQVCLTVFFTMFSLIAFFWAEQYHRKFYDTQTMLPRLRILFLVVNALLWVFEIVIVVLAVVLHQLPQSMEEPHVAAPNEPTAPFSWFPPAFFTPNIFSPPPIDPPVATPTSLTHDLSTFLTNILSGVSSRDASASPLIRASFATPASPTAPSPEITPAYSQDPAGGPLYQTSVYVVIMVDCLFALAFAIYGVALFVQKYTHSLGTGLRRELIITLVVTIIFFLCFLLRVIMFLYRPITGELIDPYLYRTLAYFIPEIVAVVLQVGVVYLMQYANPASGAPTVTGSGWKRQGPRPSVEDDVYYAADQDARASAMPAPIAAAHEKLMKPRPMTRTNFSNPTVASSPQTTAGTLGYHAGGFGEPHGASSPPEFGSPPSASPYATHLLNHPQVRQASASLGMEVMSSNANQVSPPGPGYLSTSSQDANATTLASLMMHSSSRLGLSDMGGPPALKGAQAKSLPKRSSLAFSGELPDSSDGGDGDDDHVPINMVRGINEAPSESSDEDFVLQHSEHESLLGPKFKPRK